MHGPVLTRTAAIRQSAACFRIPIRFRQCALVAAALFGSLRALSQPSLVSPSNFSSPAGLSNETPAAAVSQDLEIKLAEARAALAAAEALGEAAITNAVQGIPGEDIAARGALLQRLVRLLEQQTSNVAELESAKQRHAQVARDAQAWTGFAESPPFSILLADRVHHELQAERLKSANGEAAIFTMDQLMVENRSSLAQAEERIRQLNEELESAHDAAIAARLAWRRELERLRSQVAAVTAWVFDSERQLRQQALAESRIRVAWLERQLVIADANAAFTQADLDHVTAGIDSERKQLDHELNETQARSVTVRQELEAARTALRQTQSGSNPASAALARATEVVSVRELQLETAQAGVRVLRLMLESENVERTMWEMRFASYASRSVETLAESRRRLRAFSKRLDLWNDFQRQQLQLTPALVQFQEARIRALPQNSDLLPLARERLTALRERDQLFLRLVRRIDEAQRLSQRWEEGLQMAEGRLPFLGRVQNLFTDARSLLHKLWTFELFTAEDTITVDGQKITGRRGITLGKIVMAILILAVGIWLTGLISRFTEPIIIRRLKIEPNQANLLRRWFRALMVVCLVVFSLVSVKIPLTIFAFAGGALAIGLGFGMQTLLKNFVSGIIILFERPFRVGDVLEVAGQRGTVTQIGLRSSVLQLWDGIETLIPNSSLLENNVSNWTYSNRKVRFTISVGVAYGTDTRRVLQLLADVADRHGLVEKEPKPQALFTDFTDSALSFELRYWLDVIHVNAAQVGSDLRQMIAGAFVENGIVIAFPQRDLHLDAGRPLRVEISAPQRIDRVGTEGQQPLAASSPKQKPNHEPAAPV